MQLGNILTYKKGRAPGKIKLSDRLLVYLTPDYLRNGGDPYYVEDFASKVVVKDEDLLLLWDGSNAGEFFKAKNGILSSTMVKFNFDEKKYNKSFLYYQLKSIEDYLKAQTNGSGIPHVDKEILLNLEVKEYDENEQIQIASILNLVEKALLQTESLIIKNQRIKAGLVQDLLNNGIDALGHIRNAKTSRYTNKKGILFPEDWELYSIEEITEHVGSGVTPKGGSNVYTHEGTLLLRSQNILVGAFNFEDMAYINDEINKTMRRSLLEDFDVLLNITGASIGRSHFVPENFPKANVNQHVCAIRLKNKSADRSLFISTYLNSYYGQKQIKRLLGASNREGLNYQQIREILIPMPKIEDNSEFERISSILNAINDHINELKKEYQKFKRIKKGLMQDLLTQKE